MTGYTVVNTVDLGKHVEIGGGSLYDGFGVNLDPIHGSPGFRQYAQHVPWPLEDDSVATVRASAVLEHIPAGPPRIAVFNEAHRVLEPGGTFEIVVPLVGWSNEDGEQFLCENHHAWADPTHVSYWWLPESLLYFCEGPFKAHADYGVSLFAEFGGWSFTEFGLGRAVLVKPHHG